MLLEAEGSHQVPDQDGPARLLTINEGKELSQHLRWTRTASSQISKEVDSLGFDFQHSHLNRLARYGVNKTSTDWYRPGLPANARTATVGIPNSRALSAAQVCNAASSSVWRLPAVK